MSLTSYVDMVYYLFIGSHYVQLCKNLCVSVDVKSFFQKFLLTELQPFLPYFWSFCATGSSVPLDSDLLPDSCSGLNKTVYTYPYQKAAKVKLPNGVKAKLPVGTSEFQWYLDSLLCTFYVKTLGEFCRKLFLL